MSGNSSGPGGFEDLLNALKDPSQQDALSRGIAAIRDGDWEGLIQWGGANGYVFSYGDLETAFARYPNLASTMASTPGLTGWQPASLLVAKMNAAAASP